MTRMLAFALALVVGAPAGATAQPEALTQSGLDPRVGERIPLDLVFNSADGRRLALGSLFGDSRPVVLVMTYVRCRMLCSLVLRGAVDAVREMPLVLGRDYRVVMVSIDPSEDVASAAARRKDILRMLGRDEGDWTYLVGAERAIRALADSLGFRYSLDARTDQFAHPAVIFVLAPDARIARYLQGVSFPPAELAAALRAAARGDLLAQSLPESILSCFRFDPALRTHRDSIERYLRFGGALVMLALASSIAGLLVWERRRRR